MESIDKKVILVALLLALITTFLIFKYINRAPEKPKDVETVEVYVAAKTMPPKHVVTNSDVKLEKVAKDYANPKAIQNKSDIVGKTLKDRVIEGEQILTERLTDSENKLTLSYNIPDGKRAVSININEQIAVSDLLRPGDFVDVIASFDKEESNSGDTKTTYPRITKIILQKVEVLAIGQMQSVSEETLKELPKTATLAVAPEDLEKLVFASEYASIRFALRPVEDDKTINTKGIKREDIIPGTGTTSTTGITSIDNSVLNKFGAR